MINSLTLFHHCPCQTRLFLTSELLVAAALPLLQAAGRSQELAAERGMRVPNLMNPAGCHSLSLSLLPCHDGVLEAVAMQCLLLGSWMMKPTECALSDKRTCNNQHGLHPARDRRANNGKITPLQTGSGRVLIFLKGRIHQSSSLRTCLRCYGALF